MTPEHWQKIVGSTVADRYPLRKLIVSTEGSAVYSTSYDEGNAALKLIPASGFASDVPPFDYPQVEHPHIIRLYFSGVCQMDQSSFRYFVMEPVDENLAPALAQRALSPDETREMLQPTLEALAFLHENGLVHTKITPANIFAVGDSLKLSADSIRPAKAPATAAEDMRLLGLTVIEALTQERQPSAMAALPQPFRDIVEHSLERTPVLRWSARQSARCLAGIAPGAVVPSAQPVGTPLVSTQAALSPRDKIVALVRSWQMDLAKLPIPIWIYPVVAVLLLVALGLGLSRAKDSAPRVQTSDGKNQTAKKHANPVALPYQPKPTPFAPPPKIAAVPMRAPMPTSLTDENRSTARGPSASGPAGSGGWLVITASYTKQEDAERRAREIGQRFPQFKSSVFPPSQIDTHYLVILGSGLSEANADALRQRAVDSGLPPDTYIKSFSSARPPSPE